MELVQLRGLLYISYGPDETVLVDSFVEVDLSGIEEGISVTVKWRGQPVVICNRTAKEIAEARTTELRILKDRQAHNPNLESAEEARDFARSASKGCVLSYALIAL
ncbi:hypothetical protein RM11_0304 [Bartonella quintana RM-11]|nr:hypothetical protein RM11_0304 [Bartonella quintana RM-11]